MNISKGALALFGTLVGVIVLLTLVSGGAIQLGTSQQGPYFNLGFKGPGGPIIGR